MYYVAASRCCGFSILGLTDSLESAEEEEEEEEEERKAQRIYLLSHESSCELMANIDKHTVVCCWGFIKECGTSSVLTSRRSSCTIRRISY